MEEDADFRPPKKKRCTRKPETQFLTMSEEEMAEISKVFVPANSEKHAVGRFSFSRVEKRAEFFARRRAKSLSSRSPRESCC
jgi:hypothetical protein